MYINQIGNERINITPKQIKTIVGDGLNGAMNILDFLKKIQNLLVLEMLILIKRNQKIIIFIVVPWKVSFVLQLTRKLNNQKILNKIKN